MRILDCNDDGCQAADHLAQWAALHGMTTTLISGINVGENGSDDALCSGAVATMAAACGLDAPATAVSLAGENPSHYANAARVTPYLVVCLRTDELLAPRLLLNGNVHDFRHEEVEDVHATRARQRHEAAAATPQVDPNDRPVYWNGLAGALNDEAGPGTDFRAIAQRCVSVASLQTDVAAYERMGALAQWLGT